MMLVMYTKIYAFDNWFLLVVLLFLWLSKLISLVIVFEFEII